MFPYMVFFLWIFFLFFSQNGLCRIFFHIKLIENFVSWFFFKHCGLLQSFPTWFLFCYSTSPHVCFSKLSLSNLFFNIELVENSAFNFSHVFFFSFFFCFFFQNCILLFFVFFFQNCFYWFYFFNMELVDNLAL